MSDLNNKLLEHYLANGATSKSLPMAEREALIAAGAADGTWHTYLVGQGYSGHTNEMLHKYLGDLGYTSPALHDRWYAAVLDENLLGYALSFSKLGIAGAEGFVIDGTKSKFYTDSAGTIECTTADSDPVGAVEDLSGNGNNVIQTTSGNKPVYRTNGGVKGFRAGLISAVQRELYLTNVSVLNPYTFICVQKHSFGASFTVSMGFDGPTGGSTDITVLNSSTEIRLSDSAFEQGVAESANPRMTYVHRATAGGLATFGGDGLACSSITAQVKSNPGADAAATIFLGDAGPSGGLDPSDTFFALFANVQLTADQRNTVFAYIASKFNGVVT